MVAVERRLTEAKAQARELADTLVDQLSPYVLLGERGWDHKSPLILSNMYSASIMLPAQSQRVRSLITSYTGVNLDEVGHNPNIKMYL